MNYHISNGLILQEFKTGCECPLCKIQNIVESQLTDQFLSEAVMVDNYRNHVNKKGFCDTHTREMFLKPNKLSLALQHSTRIKTLAGHIDKSGTGKAAKKQAEFFINAKNTCIICEIAQGNMIRYYKTIAEMFYNEPEFEVLLNKLDGFCFAHYGELMKYSSYARSSTNKYRKALAKMQERNIDRLLDELQWFCDKHDYRNADKDWGNSKDSLIRSIYKLHGIKQI